MLSVAFAFFNIMGFFFWIDDNLHNILPNKKKLLILILLSPLIGGYLLIKD
jgi:hypothetical protein